MKEKHGRLNRRQFLAGVSASAWLAATHASGVSGAALGPSVSAGLDSTARIKSLRLHTAAPLAAMKNYYVDLLGLGVLEESPRELTIKAGETPITFVGIEPGTSGSPFYHFAFNIPQNKLLAAREWQKKRTALIPPYARLRDPQFPDDVVHFSSWNAHSIFFWDPAGNLLEYIARHDLQNSADGPFGSADILYASEIAFIVDDVPSLAADLKEAFGLGQYKRGSDQFTAIGDELGLLLVMKRGRILGFDEGRPAGVFATTAALRTAGTAQYMTPGFPYQVSSSP